MQNIFITGGTGYIGSRLIKALERDGNFCIQALVRQSSASKLPQGCEVVIGDALDAATYKHGIKKSSTFIHLVGVAHPSPAKKEEFKKIDLVSIHEAVNAAVEKEISHFIYLSVSMYPANIMKAYQEVRAEGEAILTASGLATSFIRPWYVLGPGHWWPVFLKPFYWIAKMIPSKREAATELDTVTIKQMIRTLVYAVKNQPAENAVYGVQKIRSFNQQNIYYDKHRTCSISI